MAEDSRWTPIAYKEETVSLLLRWRTVLPYLVAILLGLALGPALSWLGGWLRPPAAQAAEPPVAAAVAPDSPQAVYTCTPSYVGEFIQRVHVQCTAPAEGTIYWFATPTSDSKRAARVLSVMLTARSLGKNLRIYYDSAASGASYGCQASDCRPINYIEMAP